MSYRTQSEGAQMRAPMQASVPARAQVATGYAVVPQPAAATVSAAEADLHDQLATHASDYAKVAELDGTLRELAAEKASLEEQWLLAAELADG